LFPAFFVAMEQQGILGIYKGALGPFGASKRSREQGVEEGGFSSARRFGILSSMNTVISAVMIFWIFGMVIYLTKDM